MGEQIISEVFRKSPDTAVASYDYFDIAEGTGVQVFYGFAYTENLSTYLYALGRSTAYSSLIETSFAGSASPGGTVFDKDFDLQVFETPKKVGGTAEVTICEAVVFAGTSGTDTQTLTIKLRKWDGTTETDIATKTLSFVLTFGVTIQKNVFVIRFAIPDTHFKKGETLRLSVIVTSDLDGTLTDTIYIGHDPENRDGTGIIPSTDDPRTITNLLFHCPFKLGL